MNDIKFDIIKHSVIKAKDTPDLYFIPAIVKRRANNVDKAVLYTLNECIDDNVRHVYFSSRQGEFDRLIKIIEQYRNENEVSPTVFSSSVHNYSVGLFSILRQSNIPSTAIAAGENSFETGLVTALTDGNAVLYCFTGEEEDEIFGGCFYLIPGDKFSLKFQSAKTFSSFTLYDFEKFLNEKENQICGTNCVIIRL